jgi:hypothetical protein
MAQGLLGGGPQEAAKAPAFQHILEEPGSAGTSSSPAIGPLLPFAAMVDSPEPF